MYKPSKKSCRCFYGLKNDSLLDAWDIGVRVSLIYRLLLFFFSFPGVSGVLQVGVLLYIHLHQSISYHGSVRVEISKDVM